MVVKKASPFGKNDKDKDDKRCANCGSSSHATAGCKKKK